MRSYCSIYNLGHAAVADLLKGPVIVEEKVDGSQISFGVLDGELRMRSKGADINIVAPEGMFLKGVETVKGLQERLQPGWVYRGEFLAKPKHNALAYDRYPNGHIMLWDVEVSEATYLSPEHKAAESARFGLECVPTLYRGVVDSADKLRGLLETPSVLGGQKIEGMVIKPEKYDVFGRDKKVLMAKFVSEAFKEVHSQTWTKEHKTPGGSDFIGALGQQYNTQARWQKAVQHLSEAGKLENSPRDIPQLIAEIPNDISAECTEEIKNALFEWAWPQLRRQVIRGFPEFYKEYLLKKQFETENTQCK